MKRAISASIAYETYPVARTAGPTGPTGPTGPGGGGLNIEINGGALPAEPNLNFQNVGGGNSPPNNNIQPFYNQIVAVDPSGAATNEPREFNLRLTNVPAGAVADDPGNSATDYHLPAVQGYPVGAAAPAAVPPVGNAIMWIDSTSNQVLMMDNNGNMRELSGSTLVSGSQNVFGYATIPNGRT
jgi:hypothetical protein